MGTAGVSSLPRKGLLPALQTGAVGERRVGGFTHFGDAGSHLTRATGLIMEGGKAGHQQGMVSPATRAGPGLCREGYPQVARSSEPPAGQQPPWKVKSVHRVAFVRATFFANGVNLKLS